MEKFLAEAGTVYFWLAIVGLPYLLGLLTTATYGPISKGVKTGASKVSQSLVLRSKKAQDRIFEMCDALSDAEFREHTRWHTMMTLGSIIFNMLLLMSTLAVAFMLNGSAVVFFATYASGALMLLAGWNTWKIGKATRTLIFLERSLLMYEDIRLPPDLENFKYPPKIG